VKELRSEIEIEAPTERVWGVLTDFAAYPEWNPFIRRVSGRAELDERQAEGSEVVEYRPYEDGMLQAEVRTYTRRDGGCSERGPYWYFRYDEGGEAEEALSRKDRRP